MDKPFVLQWYWQESVMHPYKKTKAWYYGPREKWMKLDVKKEKRKMPWNPEHYSVKTKEVINMDEIDFKIGGIFPTPIYHSFNIKKITEAESHFVEEQKSKVYKNEGNTTTLDTYI